MRDTEKGGYNPVEKVRTNSEEARKKVWNDSGKIERRSGHLPEKMEISWDIGRKEGWDGFRRDEEKVLNSGNIG